ncbi:MAG: hypothetical protein ACI9SQ_001847 [Rubritalea sp.]
MGWRLIILKMMGKLPPEGSMFPEPWDSSHG